MDGIAALCPGWPALVQARQEGRSAPRPARSIGGVDIWLRQAAEDVQRLLSALEQALPDPEQRARLRFRLGYWDRRIVITASTKRRRGARGMERAVNRHITLLEALLGERWRKDVPFHLIVLTEFYELSTEEGMVIDAFTTRCKKALAAYKYTAADVVARLHTSARAVQRLARRGDLKGYKLDGRWMFTEAQIERYVQTHTYRGRERV